MDANSPLAAEGIPYELETFTQLGTVPDDPAVQDNGGILLPKRRKNLSCIVASSPSTTPP
jgi:hypothetical protein